MQTILCTEADAGMTVASCLGRHIPAAPTPYLNQLLQKGKVSRDGIAVSAQDTVQDGDILILPGSRRLQEFLIESVKKPVILFESREILIAAKPAGLAVHAGLGHEADNLTARLQQLLRKRKEPYRLAPAHRLDVGTSGPVIFGKGRRACTILGQLFMDGMVEKYYLGLAAGYLGECGELLSPVPAKGKWKGSRTEYRSIGRFGSHSLLELRLHSGRTHQIRRQLADCGHPLVGDHRYGGTKLAGLDRLFLHGCRLALPNPFDGSRLEIHCPLPDDLTAILTLLSTTLPAKKL